MPKPDHTSTNNALVLVTDPALTVRDEALVQLQASASEQFRRLRSIRHEEALRGLLLGLQLNRIKASMPYGTFGAWAKEHATIGERWVAYLMKLSLVFVAKTKATKPEILSLPGDQTELNLDGLAEGAQKRFVEKALSFCADHSLSELLSLHGVKDPAKLGGARTRTEQAEAGDQPAAAPDPQALAAAVRDEIGEAIERLERLLLREARLAHIAQDHTFLRGVQEALGNLYLKGDEHIRQLLAISGDAASARSLKVVSAA